MTMEDLIPTKDGDDTSSLNQSIMSDVPRNYNFQYGATKTMK